MRKFAEGTEALAAGGVAATALLAAFPIVSPLVQIWLLAQKPKEEIEDIVRMKEPLQVILFSFGQIPLSEYKYKAYLRVKVRDKNVHCLLNSQQHTTAGHRC